MAIAGESRLAPVATQSEFPLRLGDAEHFMRVDTMLRDAQYSEVSICRVLGITSLSAVGYVDKDVVDATDPPSLGLLIRLFLLGKIVQRGDIETVLDAAAIRSLQALDLIRPFVGKSERASCFAPVLLYPVADLFIASDRHENPDGSPFVPPPDVVFPAIFVGTHRFLRVLPKSPTRDALDLCSGTGIGALVLSRHVERVVAADITARATHFARFNRLLNHRDNVEVVQGDLYEAVEGRDFDRIIAHPPTYRRSRRRRYSATPGQPAKPSCSASLRGCRTTFGRGARSARCPPAGTLQKCRSSGGSGAGSANQRPSST